MAGITERTGLENLIGLVGKTAPAIASALGTPLAGVAVDFLVKAFGASSSDDLVSKITSDPQSVFKLRELENQHAEMLAKINQAKFEAMIDDRKNARQREVELAKAGSKDWVTPFLAVAFLGIYGAIQAYVIYNPTGADDVISARVQDIMVMIISYFFGSSSREIPRP